MRLGLFGGTFDPVHRGHLDPVRQARRELALDGVIYLPTACPPHKPERSFARAHARFAMVELALLDEPDLRVSDVELTPGRHAFTVDSVAHFRRLHSGADLFLLLGSDSFLELPSWSRWRELVAALELAVLVRPGWPPQGGLPPEIDELARSARVHFLRNPPVEISSTELRRTLASGGDPPPETLPELVLKYIRKYDLYR